MNEELLVTVKAVPGNFEVFAGVTSRHWYKRMFGMKDYIPLLITALNTAVSDEQSEESSALLK